MKRIIAVLSMLLFTGTLLGDTIYLDDGTVLDGTIISRNADTVVCRTQNGIEEINRKYIKRIIGAANSDARPDISQKETKDFRNQTKKSDVPLIPANNEAAPSVTQPEAELIPVENENGPYSGSMPNENTYSEFVQSENTLKFGFDISGSHKVSGNVNVSGVGSASGSGSSEADAGVSVSWESVGYADRNVGLGVGASYQLPRQLSSASTGKFNFMPIYGLLKIRSNPSKHNEYVYGVGQMGYNFFFGDKDYKGTNGSLGGGLYYGIGVGANINKFQMEFMYSVNKGSFSDSGIVYSGGHYYNYNTSGTIDYSKVNLTFGLVF
jgi:hypothetical protein